LVHGFVNQVFSNLKNFLKQFPNIGKLQIEILIALAYLNRLFDNLPETIRVKICPKRLMR